MLFRSKELESRKVNPDLIEQVKQELTEIDTKKGILDSRKVNSWTRLIHFVVDIISFLVVAMILGLILGLFIPTPTHMTMTLFTYGVLLIAFFLYFAFMEYKYQKTIGKFLTRSKVMMSDGRRPELNEIMLRTACRLIPLDRISFLFSKNGFHDRLSDTIVIKEE